MRNCWVWFQNESYYLRSLGEDVRKVQRRLSISQRMEPDDFFGVYIANPNYRSFLLSPAGTGWAQQTVPGLGGGLSHTWLLWTWAVLLQRVPHQLLWSAAVDALRCEFQRQLLQDCQCIFLNMHCPFFLVFCTLVSLGDGQPAGSGDRNKESGPLQPPGCFAPLPVRLVAVKKTGLPVRFNAEKVSHVLCPLLVKGQLAPKSHEEVFQMILPWVACFWRYLQDLLKHIRRTCYWFSIQVAKCWFLKTQVKVIHQQAWAWLAACFSLFPIRR